MEPFDTLVMLGIWCKQPYFYRLIAIKWVMWSTSYMLSLLSQDVFHGTHYSLGQSTWEPWQSALLWY